MASHPIPSGALAVQRVVEYEPPARAVAYRRVTSPVRSRSRSSPPGPSGPAVLPPALRSAAAFADAALRRVLEVVDLRRPPAHLQPLLAPGLAESVLSGSAAERAGAATLQRLGVQAVRPGDPATAVEVFGSYRRGRRVHALACRVERAGCRWQIVALHIG